MSIYKWVSSNTRSALPSGAVQAGTDLDGSLTYVGKAKFQNDEIPCKIIPKRRQAYVSHNGLEHEVTTYEVMVQNTIKWITNNGGWIPAGAVSGGRTSTGETLYIGRVKHSGAYVLGKVHPSHGCLYIPFSGKEFSYKSYEIMVVV